MRLFLSPRAITDLDEIQTFVSRDNPRAAVHLLDALEATCHKLASMPRVGIRRDDLCPGLRAFAHGAYVIYSLVQHDDLLRIVRVMHGARNVQASDFRP